MAISAYRWRCKEFAAGQNSPFVGHVQLARAGKDAESTGCFEVACVSQRQRSVEADRTELTIGTAKEQDRLVWMQNGCGPDPVITLETACSVASMPCICVQVPVIPAKEHDRFFFFTRAIVVDSSCHDAVGLKTVCKRIFPNDFASCCIVGAESFVGAQIHHIACFGQNWGSERVDAAKVSVL